MRKRSLFSLNSQIQDIMVYSHLLFSTHPSIWKFMNLWTLSLKIDKKQNFKKFNFGEVENHTPQHPHSSAVLMLWNGCWLHTQFCSCTDVIRKCLWGVRWKKADKPQFVPVFAIVPAVLKRTLVALRQYDQRSLTPSLSAVPIPLEGLILTDSCAEGGPCSELSWVGVLILLFVSLDCSKVEAWWNNSLSHMTCFPQPPGSPHSFCKRSAGLFLYVYKASGVNWSELPHPHAVKCHSTSSAAHQ